MAAWFRSVGPLFLAIALLSWVPPAAAQSPDWRFEEADPLPSSTYLPREAPYRIPFVLERSCASPQPTSGSGTAPSHVSFEYDGPSYASGSFDPPTVEFPGSNGLPFISGSAASECDSRNEFYEVARTNLTLSISARAPAFESINAHLTFHVDHENGDRRSAEVIWSRQVGYMPAVNVTMPATIPGAAIMNRFDNGVGAYHLVAVAGQRLEIPLIVVNNGNGQTRVNTTLEHVAGFPEGSPPPTAPAPVVLESRARDGPGAQDTHPIVVTLTVPAPDESGSGPPSFQVMLTFEYAGAAPAQRQAEAWWYARFTLEPRDAAVGPLALLPGAGNAYAQALGIMMVAIMVAAGVVVSVVRRRG